MSAKSGSKTNISRPPVLSACTSSYIRYVCTSVPHISIIWFPRGHRRTTASRSAGSTLLFHSVIWQTKRSALLIRFQLLKKDTLNFHNFIIQFLSVILDNIHIFLSQKRKIFNIIRKRYFIYRKIEFLLYL